MIVLCWMDNRVLFREVALCLHMSFFKRGEQEELVLDIPLKCKPFRSKVLIEASKAFIRQGRQLPRR